MTALVPVATTALLKNLLENGLVTRGATAQIGSDATVSAMPPDRVTTGGDEKPQINLYLYQTQLRGLYRVSRYVPDGEKNGGVPQALEFSYLMTVYGAQDFQIEVLTGYAVETLQSAAVLETERVQELLKNVASTEGGRIVLPALEAIAKQKLGERIERVTTSLYYPPIEELSALWGMFQVTYRPALFYKVGVSLKEPK